MNTFNYVTREYVPSVDLNTLTNTYNTLEQGHKEAVKAASDLEVAISTLDMNEAEDGFKQQLANEIKTTIDENTIYGNSYGALDDLILKKGNILSDGRVIGRLRNNAAKKQYDAKVDSMAISEGMKQMYKEENPYYYKDGEIDKSTGRYLPGELWKPTTNPVNTIPEVDIQKYALQFAAKEAGSGESISFLDKNGRPTSDPNQSEDGTMYKKVGTQYERLPKNKIIKAYKLAIQSIPGAEDSLRQDYKYDNWKRKKLVDENSKKGENVAPYIQGLTDKNGNVYSYDKWLTNKMTGFADIASYNHVYSSVDYGTALQNRKARQNMAKQQNALLSTLGLTGAGNTGFGTFKVGTKEVEVNAFAGAQTAKSIANQQGLNIIKRFTGNTFKGADSISDVMNYLIKNKLATGPNTAAQYIINKYGSKMSKQDRIHLTNSLTGYVKANQQYKQMINAAGSKADGLKFSANIADGIFTNDNKYGSAVIKAKNDYYETNNEYHALVGSEILEGVAKKYNTTINGLRNKGINITKTDDGNYDVVIDREHGDLMPKFASTIRIVDNEIPGTFGGWLKNKFTSGVASNNYHEYGSTPIIPEIGKTLTRIGFSYANPVTAAISGISGLTNKILGYSTPSSNVVNAYENGLKIASNIEEKIGTVKGTIDLKGIDEGSYSALWYREHALELGLTESQLQDVIGRMNSQVDNSFANINFDSGLIEELDSSGKAVKDVSNNQSAKLLIQKMYSDTSWKNNIKRTVLSPSGAQIGQPKGYTLSFTVPKGADTGKYKEGDHVRFNVYGIMEEEINYDPSYNPTVLANNAMQISRATGSIIENLGYNSHFGDTRLRPNKMDNYYNSTFMGTNNILSADKAEQLSSLLISLEQMKAQYLNGTYSDSQEHLVQLDNSLKSIANAISDASGASANDIYYSIGNYFTDPD